jgi:hypothetical protein
MSRLQEDLTQALDQTEWEWLLPHLERDAVILVAAGLSLVEVGVALATDNAAAVEGWIAEQRIGKPSLAQRAIWNAGNPRFTALIVQPYVLAQELAQELAQDPGQDAAQDPA